VNARVIRIDSVIVQRQDLVWTPEQFLLCDALYARTGNQDYDDGRGGTIVEYRPDGEVFADESLASYDLRPLTDLHPPRNVTTDTARMHARGAVSAGKRHADGVHVAGRLAVWDSSLIKKFLAAFARGDAMQLSAGYELDLDHTPGTAPDGRRYDAVQRNIRINHVAAVPLGRAGTARALADSFANEWAQFDAAQWVLTSSHQHADIAPHRDRAFVDLGRWAHHDATSLRIQLDAPESPTMKKLTIKVDGRDVVIEHADSATPADIAALVSKAHVRDFKEYISKTESDAAIAAAVAKATADMAPPFGKKKAEEEEEDGKKRDAAHKAELAKVRTDAETRIDVLSTARAVHGMIYDAAGKSNEQIRLDVIETVADRTGKDGAALRKRLEAKPIGHRDGAIAERYDEAIEQLDALPGEAEKLLTKIRSAHGDERKRDGKPVEAGPITKTRTDAEAEAALPRHERTDARKAG
jgi:ribosomal protein L12E/L44/L45/RPP1/RPP2